MSQQSDPADALRSIGIHVTTAEEAIERLSTEEQSTRVCMLTFDRGVSIPVQAGELEQIRRGLTQLRAQAGAATGTPVLRGPQNVELRPRGRTALVDRQRLRLTPSEYELLRVLLERIDEVVTVDELSLGVFGYPALGGANFIHAHVSRLRRKLRAAGADDVITTVRGSGYFISGGGDDDVHAERPSRAA